MPDKLITEKLQKVLARAGLGSRRTLEGWIQAGRVSVDGETAKLGDRVSVEATIRVDDKPIVTLDQALIKRQILLYHKRVGEVCTRADPEQRPTVFDCLPELEQGRWISVGRLDFNTSGLLLFTNDGELAHKLMHPSSLLEREYAVRVYGPVSSSIIDKLSRGVELEDGMACFNQIVPMAGDNKNQWFRVILTQGRNRIIRRLWQSQDIKVNRLIRLRYGPIQLPDDLPLGSWTALSKNEEARLVSLKN